MENILYTRLQVLGLLVNLTEHSNNNRKQLESTTVNYYGNSDQNEPKDKLELMEQDIRGCHGDNSSLRALICLFLTHYSKAESANIEVQCIHVCVVHGPRKSLLAHTHSHSHRSPPLSVSLNSQPRPCPHLKEAIKLKVISATPLLIE